ncbi:HAMP domain-containing sensor histidine kinase [Leptolyngbya sp. FACHB-261]|uniref:sensor histidine kinase n=1 Tax=Leptolyngbya sp. FACHB-261 TaxID=2692806 RepID=UPI0016853849|nr:HAMP domain-containing sensor histidine kinase [Leptolyngbya sp. FACHB-261]MBD2103600.1 HAMP domain-containing histidine kinase [Leptolyngbya sp. FACHB-261]
MIDFSKLLREKSDLIIEHWVEAVQQDSQIESVNSLPYKAVRDSLPRVLQALATVLSQSESNDTQLLVETSLEHGILRAEQGFEPLEIAREYRLLRSVISSMLEADLMEASALEVFRVIRLTDAVIDEAIARCFKSYTETRLKELEQLQSQLTLTNQELTRLLRANQDNLSHLAHELKTPLTSIIGYSDLFLRSHRSASEVRDSFPNLEHVQRVLNSGRQLLHLINDALEISRCEAGEMRLHPNQTDVRGLVNNVVEMVEPLACSKDLELVVNCEDAPEEVVTDPLRLQQILTNLLSNAIRYTQSGSISLTCQSQPGQCWSITVKDTGVGIELEDQARIFDPYFRVPAIDKSYIANSTGLGLAIVSRLVKLLRGEIQLVSEVGVGSTFTVTLPLAIEVPEKKATQLQLD